jgi:hypothetical protein
MIRLALASVPWTVAAASISLVSASITFTIVTRQDWLIQSSTIRRKHIGNFTSCHFPSRHAFSCFSLGPPNTQAKAECSVRRQTAGGGSLRGSPAYFAGAVKRLQYSHPRHNSRCSPHFCFCAHACASVLSRAWKVFPAVVPHQLLPWGDGSVGYSPCPHAMVPTRQSQHRCSIDCFTTCQMSTADVGRNGQAGASAWHRERQGLNGKHERPVQSQHILVAQFLVIAGIQEHPRH